VFRTLYQQATAHAQRVANVEAGYTAARQDLAADELTSWCAIAGERARSVCFVASDRVIGAV
jgi:hypothetical protein